MIRSKFILHWRHWSWIVHLDPFSWFTPSGLTFSLVWKYKLKDGTQFFSLGRTVFRIVFQTTGGKRGIWTLRYIHFSKCFMLWSFILRGLMAAWLLLYYSQSCDCEWCSSYKILIVELFIAQTVLIFCFSSCQRSKGQWEAQSLILVCKALQNRFYS